MPKDSTPATTADRTEAAPLRRLQIVTLADGRLPFLGKSLADLGADVEVSEAPPGHSDTIRQLIQTRGKRYVQPSAPDEYLRTRLPGIDVLVATPQDLAAHGTSADQIAAEHPGLVIALLSDFGLTGPRAGWKGSEAVFKALSGSLSRSGEPGRAPLLAPGDIFLRSAAVQIAWSIVAAAYRAVDGRGGAVLDCSIFEAGAICLDPGNGMSGSGTPDIVNAHGRPAAAHLYPIYRTKDGFVRLVLLAKGQWAAMLEWMQHPPELADPELELTQVRQEAPERVIPFVQAFVEDMTTDELVTECRLRRIPASAVLSPADVLSEPHFQHSGVLTDIGQAHGKPVVTAEGMARINGVRAVARERRATTSAAEPRGLAGPSLGQGPHPLSGITVLDLGVIVAGSVASQLFAELGARVIRVENTGFPDGMRRSFDFISPSMARGHRGKESLGLDLRSEQGRAIFLELAARADVVVSNFKPGTLERLRIAYDDLVQVNPHIVCVESTAFGDSGPWQTAMGYGPLVRSGGGHSWLWRENAESEFFADGITIFPDHLVGRVCALSALACLLDRRSGGDGAHVTVAQCDVGLVQIDELLATESVTEGAAQPPGALPGRRLLSEIVLPAAGDDQWCVIDPQNAAQLAALGSVVGGEPGSDLEAVLPRWVAGRDASLVAGELQRAGVPAAQMVRVAELAEDPALVAREVYSSVAVTGTDEVVLVERFSVPRESLAYPDLEPMPMFGAQTRTILADLGRTPQQIDELFAAGVAQASELAQQVERAHAL